MKWDLLLVRGLPRGCLSTKPFLSASHSSSRAPAGSPSTAKTRANMTGPAGFQSQWRLVDCKRARARTVERIPYQLYGLDRGRLILQKIGECQHRSTDALVHYHPISSAAVVFQVVDPTAR